VRLAAIDHKTTTCADQRLSSPQKHAISGMVNEETYVEPFIEQ
jgi:hypothetical protein